MTNSTTEKKCIKCDAMIAYDDKVCLSCGAMQKGSKSSNNKALKAKAVRKEKTRKGFDLSGLVFLLISAALGYFYLFDPNSFLLPADFLITKGRINETSLFLDFAEKIMLAKDMDLINRKKITVKNALKLQHFLETGKKTENFISNAAIINKGNSASLRVVFHNKRPFVMILKPHDFMLLHEEGLFFTADNLNPLKINPWKQETLDIEFRTKKVSENFSGKLYFLQGDTCAMINIG